MFAIVKHQLTCAEMFWIDDTNVHNIWKKYERKELNALLIIKYEGWLKNVVGWLTKSYVSPLNFSVGAIPLNFHWRRKTENKEQKRETRKVAKLSIASKQLGQKGWVFEGVTPLKQYYEMWSERKNFTFHFFHHTFAMTLIVTVL